MYKTYFYKIIFNCEELNNFLNRKKKEYSFFFEEWFYMRMNLEHEKKIRNFIKEMTFINSFICGILFFFLFCFFLLNIKCLKIFFSFLLIISLLIESFLVYCMYDIELYDNHYFFVTFFLPRYYKKYDEIVKFIEDTYKYVTKYFNDDHYEYTEKRKITLWYILKRLFHYFYIFYFLWKLKRYFRIIVSTPLRVIKDNLIIRYYPNYVFEEYDSEVDSIFRKDPLPGDIPFHDWFRFDNRNFLFSYSRMLLMYNLPDVGIATWLSEEQIATSTISSFLDSNDELIQEWRSPGKIVVPAYQFGEVGLNKSVYESLSKKHRRYMHYFNYPIFYTKKINKIKKFRGKMDLLRTANFDLDGLLFFSKRKKRYPTNMVKYNKHVLKTVRGQPILIFLWVKHRWFSRLHVDMEDVETCLFYLFWMWYLERKRDYNMNKVWKGLKRGVFTYDEETQLIRCTLKYELITEMIFLTGYDGNYKSIT